MGKFDEFTEALGGDVVIEGMARPGPLPVPEALSLRGWFDVRQEAIRQGRTPDPE